MNNLILLDTHILVWMTCREQEISKEIREKIELALQENRVIISSISLWEIAMLLDKKRLNVYFEIRDFLDEIVKIDGLRVKELSPEIAAASVSLADGFHGDPADRIIVATTKVFGATLLTRDKEILKWAKSGHIKTIKV